VKGIRVSTKIGIGDAIQFTSVPENFFRHTGEKLVDIEHNWVFDFNPYVIRNVDARIEEYDLWRLHCLDAPVMVNGRTTFLTNAQAHSRHFGYPVVMNRPRLYQFEEFQYEMRRHVFLHVKGRSHGQLPEHVVKHVLDKYGEAVVLIGEPGEWDYTIEPPARAFFPKTYWELAAVLSKAHMFIGVDSGPSWVAQCYPDVITKKVRLFPTIEKLQDWMPLEWCRIGSHWDDRSAGIYNPSDDDVGFTWSYKRL
jgi:hypothetical protein